MMASPPRRVAAALPSNTAAADWWMLDIRIRILDLIYYAIVTSLGEEPTLMSPAHLERLLTNPAVDTAIQQAYTQLRLHKSQGDLPLDRSESEWKEDKRRILECLVPNRQGLPSQEPVDASDIRQFSHQASSNSHEPWPLFRISPGRSDIPQSYHTPADTPATVPRASSESGSLSGRSDRTATLDDPQPGVGGGGEQAPFSPAESVTKGSRRRRSSSTMQSDKPGKRARGPQEHICQVCNKKFPFLSKLNDHLKTHSSDKNLRCHLCKKSFKRTREVNAHLKTVHKIEPNSQPQTPPTPVPLLLHPATPPATLPLPAPPASFTPSASLALPPPRSTVVRFPGPYTPVTPQPTPEQFNQPTPAETEYRETPPAFTPVTTASSEDEPMRDQESSYQDERGEEEVKPKFAESKDKEGLELASRLGGVDINQLEYDNVTLPPLLNLNYPPKTQAPPQPQPPPTTSFSPINTEPAAARPVQAPEKEKEDPDPPEEELKDTPRVSEPPASESPERKSPESIHTPILIDHGEEAEKLIRYEGQALMGVYQDE